nr:MAG TPA: hypothetical protein [Caudoviricetes sp.]
MADYNVNMKQWNGTSFDNVLPLAYNAKQLEGQSLAEVKQWVQDNELLLYTGQYTGTGTYGQSHPTSITFPFEPIIWFTPEYQDAPNHMDSYGIVVLSMFGGDYGTTGFPSGGGITRIKKAGNTLSWYNDTNANYQLNYSGVLYYFAAIGGYDMGGPTEWTITSSGTWTVPKTGRYYMELYGYGGAGKSSGGLPFASGGASCQSYDSVVLTKGQVINVTIALNEATTTSFDSYTVINAGNASTKSPYYGVGSGNKGKDGAYSYGGHTAVTVGSGALSANYGVGQSSQDPFGTTGRFGAIYLKYLGA